MVRLSKLMALLIVAGWSGCLFSSPSQKNRAREKLELIALIEQVKDQNYSNRYVFLDSVVPKMSGNKYVIDSSLVHAPVWINVDNDFYYDMPQVMDGAYLLKWRSKAYPDLRFNVSSLSGMTRRGYRWQNFIPSVKEIAITGSHEAIIKTAANDTISINFSDLALSMEKPAIDLQRKSFFTGEARRIIFLPSLGVEAVRVNLMTLWRGARHEQEILRGISSFTPYYDASAVAFKIAGRLYPHGFFMFDFTHEQLVMLDEESFNALAAKHELAKEFSYRNYAQEISAQMRQKILGAPLYLSVSLAS